MENLAVITAMIIRVLLERISLSLNKKNKNVIHQPRSVRIGKNWAFKTSSTVFPNTDLPAGK